MNDTNHIVTEHDIIKIFSGSFLHILAVTVTYLSATFFYSLIQNGLGSVSERLTMTSRSISSRINPVSTRFNQLIELPDDYGFILYSGEFFTASNYVRPKLDEDDSSKNTDIKNVPKPDDDTTDNPKDNEKKANLEKVKDLIIFCSNLKDLTPPTREKLLERAKPLKFDAQSVTSFLLAVADINITSQTVELESNQRLLFSEFLLLPPRGFKQNISPQEINYIATKFSYPNISVTLQNNSVTGLRKLLPQKAGDPSQTTTVVTTKDPQTTTVKAPTTQGEYKSLENNELLFNACITRQDILQEAHKKYERANTSSESVLNIAELMEMGFLDNPPVCPNGGIYSISEGLVTCSHHGNRVNPYSEHTEYLKHFKRFHHAQDAYIAGKYKEALFLVEKIVNTNKENNQAVELLGHCLMKLKDWGKAATKLSEAALRYDNDGQLHYDAAICFYASGNKNLAENHMNQCIASQWKNTQRSILKPLDFFLLKDKAAWMIPLIRKTSYLNSMLEKPPVFPTTNCYDNLMEMRKKIENNITEYLKSPEIVATKQKLETIKSHLSSLRNFETEEIEKAQKNEQTARENLREMIEGSGPGSLAVYLSKKLADQSETSIFCSGKGRYFVNETDNLDCSVHRKILDNSNISTSFNFSPKAISLINSAILEGEYSKHKERRECHERQEKLSGKMKHHLTANSLADYKQTADFDPSLTTCPCGGARYKIQVSTTSSSKFVIYCDDHYSKFDYQNIPGSKNDTW
jgi:tetratricopeptide (TPR) repeat protein